MIHLDQENLRKLQLIELELLVEFDRICRKNNIRYTLTGGTLLGAVRHGGFIPWDDDADVSMLRQEYEKFKKACEIELNKKYYFQDMQITQGYRWGYGKLRKKDTLFLREYQEHMPYSQGVFIDIFPRDGVPNSCISQALYCRFTIKRCPSNSISVFSSYHFRGYPSFLFGIGNVRFRTSLVGLLLLFLTKFSYSS